MQCSSFSLSLALWFAVLLAQGWIGLGQTLAVCSSLGFVLVPCVHYTSSLSLCTLWSKGPYFRTLALSTAVPPVPEALPAPPLQFSERVSSPLSSPSSLVDSSRVLSSSRFLTPDRSQLIPGSDSSLFTYVSPFLLPILLLLSCRTYAPCTWRR